MGPFGQFPPEAGPLKMERKGMRFYIKYEIKY
jgi:hypothetical protein